MVLSSAETGLETKLIGIEVKLNRNKEGGVEINLPAFLFCYIKFR